MNPYNLSLQIIKKISIFDSEESAILFLKKLLEQEKPCILSFINAHGFNLFLKEPKFATTLINCDLLIRDGYGMELLLKSISRNPGANLNGTDFIPVLLNSFVGKRIALIGTVDEYLEAASLVLKNSGHDVIIKKNGFLPQNEYIQHLKSVKPDVIILGMGMPNQEYLSIKLKEELNHRCLIINGGAIIDFLGNRFRRAPLWMRKAKIEWVYRLCLEPKRLSHRYLYGNYIFVRRIKSLKKSNKEIKY